MNSAAGWITVVAVVGVGVLIAGFLLTRRDRRRQEARGGRILGPVVGDSDDRVPAILSPGGPVEDFRDHGVFVEPELRVADVADAMGQRRGRRTAGRPTGGARRRAQELQAERARRRDRHEVDPATGAYVAAGGYDPNGSDADLFTDTYDSGSRDTGGPLPDPGWGGATQAPDTSGYSGGSDTGGGYSGGSDTSGGGGW